MDDWITQHQNEEKDKKKAEEQARAAKAENDRLGQSWIGGLLESRLRQSIEQVNQRLARDFQLARSDYGYGFRVSERRSGSTLPSYDWFEVYCYTKDASEIQLRGNKGLDPRAMPHTWEGSSNDWTGEAWELKVLPRGPQLLGDEDIDALFSWLVVGTSPVPEVTLTRTEKKTSGCFVATAVYGTPHSPELETLRFFRDELLLPNRLGRTLVEGYYRVGLPFSQLLEKSEGGRRVVRLLVVAPAVRVAAYLNGLSVKHRLRHIAHRDGSNRP